jgi:hypothetical protein
MNAPLKLVSCSPGEIWFLERLSAPETDLPFKDLVAAGIVKDQAALLRLGKALFWDMQAGSGGVQSCATRRGGKRAY